MWSKRANRDFQPCQRFKPEVWCRDTKIARNRWLTQRYHVVPVVGQEGHNPWGLSEYHLCPVWSRDRESTETKDSGLWRTEGTSSRNNTESASQTRGMSFIWESQEGSEMSWWPLSKQGSEALYFFFWKLGYLKTWSYRHILEGL